MQWLGGHISTHFHNCFSGFFGGRKRHKTPLLHIACIITLAWVLLPRGETSQGTDNATRIQISHGSNYTGFWCSYFGSSTLICHCIPPTVSHFSELAKRELVFPWARAVSPRASCVSLCFRAQLWDFITHYFHAVGSSRLAEGILKLSPSSLTPNSWCTHWGTSLPMLQVLLLVLYETWIIQWVLCSLSFSFLITLSVASCVSKCTNL